MRKSSLVTMALGMAAFAMSGCSGQGPELVPVRGTLLDRHGKPVFPGSIWFIADASVPAVSAGALDASSVLGEDGTFNLRTYPHGDGAMVGRYHVTLSLGAGSSPKLAKYAGTKTTPLSVAIPKGGSTGLVLTIEEDLGLGRSGGGPPNSRSRR